MLDALSWMMFFVIFIVIVERLLLAPAERRDLRVAEPGHGEGLDVSARGRSRRTRWAPPRACRGSTRASRTSTAPRSPTPISARTAALVELPDVRQGGGVVVCRCCCGSSRACRSSIPTPIEVGEFLVDHSDLLLPNIWVTVQTALVALVIILVVGILLGFAMGRWWPVRYFFTDLVMVLIALPAFIWALLAVMWWAFDDIGPIFVACISATPMLIVNTRQGAGGRRQSPEDVGGVPCP